MIVLENAKQRISFDADTGRLIGLLSHPHQREYLAGPAEAGPFTIWHSFRETYRFGPSKVGGACDMPPDPATIAAGRFVPGTLVESKVKGSAASLLYRDAGTGLTARVMVRLDGNRSRWTLTVTNTGTKPVEMMASFPWWDGLTLSREAGGRMLAMNQAGYVSTLWRHPGGLYGHSTQQSAQLGCLFEKQTGDCFGFYIEDAECGAKEIRFIEPSVRVGWLPPRALAPGESRTWPSTVLLLYQGSWKETAAAYGDWFQAAIKPDRVPQWVRHNESYGGAWAEKRGDEYEDRPGGSSSEIPPNAMDSFDELAVHYLRVPMQTLEFAFYCRQSQFKADRADGQPLGPQPRRHTDGWNDIREDLGGMPALRRGVEAVHAVGRRVTLYVEGLIVPDDSELFRHIPDARDWIVTNADGTSNGPYTSQRFVHMCPGCVGWQDHVVAMSERLMRESGIDGIRLDSLGFYFWPCHNPAHHHDSPYDYNRWLQQLYQKVARAVRTIKPDALLSTEAPADFNHRHFNHSLHQIFSMELPVALGEEASPMRVALPGYRLHTGAAVAGASLQLQPLWWPPKAADAPWLAGFAMAAPVFCDGDASHPDPTSDCRDLWCRWVRGTGEDVITGARVMASEDPSAANFLLPREDLVRAVVKVPLGYAPAAAWVFDMQARKLLPLAWNRAGDEISFTVETSWFMAILTRKAGSVPCLIEMQERVKKGTTVKLSVQTLGMSKPARATLQIPAVVGCEAISVEVPGEAQIMIPADTRPAWYRAELAGKGIRPAACLFRVTP